MSLAKHVRAIVITSQPPASGANNINSIFTYSTVLSSRWAAAVLHTLDPVDYRTVPYWPSPPLLSGTALVVVRALPGVRTPPDPRAECQEQLSRRREAASVGSAEPRLTTHDAYTDIRHLCIICPGCGYHMPRVRTWPARDAAQSCVTRLRCQPCTMIRWYNNL